MSPKFVLSVLMASTLISGAAFAQGLAPGAQRGAEEGGAAGGAVGAVVGGAVGAAAGVVGGILGVEQRPRFRSYVQREHVTSYRYEEPVRVGAVLPNAGVTYYEVPPEYQAPGYRYTVVNDVPVLVDPNTGRIVEVIE
ncbi:protein of unknown function DUF1236 [Methylocella silvestris BL2]|uniref:DUF1236 domain-containing protein n=1 Tax=Methylocella silvestris (strain DSM 15510 / CIP 108128 / LMG 27833 / NCIMB 13906 / BL2) TaxID=395965 RepID=B8ELX0_METSB|nr:DUF1236 domain-containing protein [Methylocella silvestris]ACK50751.1 protein of unknown function DUF1236 [Methylocella silvestris BL2]